MHKLGRLVFPLGRLVVVQNMLVQLVLPVVQVGTLAASYKKCLNEVAVAAVAAVGPEHLVDLVLGADVPVQHHLGLEFLQAVLALPGPVLQKDGPDMRFNIVFSKKSG